MGQEILLGDWTGPVNASIEDSYQEGSSSEEEEEEDDDDDDDDDSAKEHNDPPPPGGDQRLIELTLGLGVFELKGQPKRGDAAESPESEAEDSDTESTSSASSSSIGSSDGELPRGSVTEVPRAGMKRKRIAAVQGGEGGGATGAVSAAQGVSTTRSISDPPSMKRRTVRSPTSTEPSPPVTMMAGTPLIREVDASDKDGHRA
ncbi:hypothetical protein DL93DRAFT_693642 [Clavulina sp. PMI_390]|nr:hypothetical protein DL93DRAFT_693642 [Clavulina sp. PMI_390]